MFRRVLIAVAVAACLVSACDSGEPDEATRELSGAPVAAGTFAQEDDLSVIDDDLDEDLSVIDDSRFTTTTIPACSPGPRCVPGVIPLPQNLRWGMSEQEARRALPEGTRFLRRETRAFARTWRREWRRFSFDQREVTAGLCEDPRDNGIRQCKTWQIFETNSGSRMRLQFVEDGGLCDISISPAEGVRYRDVLMALRDRIGVSGTSLTLGRGDDISGHHRWRSQETSAGYYAYEPPGLEVRYGSNRIGRRLEEMHEALYRAMVREREASGARAID